MPIFITIDPDRDTVQRLKEFEAFVHPDLVALTGSKSEISSVMKKFRVYGNKSSSSNGDNYLIEDIKKFKNHIFKYHSIDGKGDYSLHEENGRYFTVSREFYKMIENL